MYIKLPDGWEDWQVIDFLGEGAHGEVHRIEKTEGGITFVSALKIISLEDYEPESEDVQAYIREIQALMLLRSCSQIVQIEDFALTYNDDTDEYCLYIRMEYLTSFSEYLRHHTMTENEIVQLGMDVTEALKVCEERNILHRDIKPGNLFVDANGRFKLGDFGESRLVSLGGSSVSLTGTMDYTAPEMAHMEHTDGRADLYSLGLVMYYLLNHNRAPFLDPSAAIISFDERQKANERRLNGEVLPPPLEGSEPLKMVILRACMADPSKRYANASQMIKALSEVAAGEMGTSDTAKETSKGRDAKSGGKRRWIIGAAVILLAGAALYAGFRNISRKTMTKGGEGKNGSSASIEKITEITETETDSAAETLETETVTEKITEEAGREAVFEMTLTEADTEEALTENATEAVEIKEITGIVELEAVTEEAKTETDKEDGEESFLQLQVDRHTSNVYADGSDEAVGRIFVDTVHIVDESGQYSAIKQTLESFSQEKEALISHYLQEYQKEIAETGGDVSYTFESEVTVRRADENFVSMIYSETNYNTGQVHPFGGEESYTYDSHTGSRVQLYDLITDSTSLELAVLRELHKNYTEQYETFSSIPSNLNYADWVLTQDGLAFKFSLGSYADGDQYVHLSVREYPDLYTEYAAVSEDMAMGLDSVYWEDIDSDGSKDSVIVVKRTYGYHKYEGYTVWINGVETSRYFDTFGDILPILFKGHGKTYLYIENRPDDGEPYLSIYDLSGGNADLLGELEMSFIMEEEEDHSKTSTWLPAGPQRFLLRSTATDEINTYVLGEDGFPRLYVEGEEWEETPAAVAVAEENQTEQNAGTEENSMSIEPSQNSQGDEPSITIIADQDPGAAIEQAVDMEPTVEINQTTDGDQPVDEYMENINSQEGEESVSTGEGEVIMLLDVYDSQNIEDLPNPMVYHLDLEEDGTEEELTISFGFDEYGIPNGVTVSFRGMSTSMTAEEIGYPEGLDMAAPYIVRADGRSYLYIFWVSAIYDMFLQVWDLNGDIPVQAGVVPNVWLVDGGYSNYSDQFTNPYSFQMDSQWFTLGGLILSRNYHIGSDGVPVPDTEYADCMLDFSHDEVYTIRDVPCEIIEDTPLENVPASGTPAICPANTHLFYYHASFGRQVDMKGDDGTVYRFTVDEANYDTINGIAMPELFSGLSYWG